MDKGCNKCNHAFYFENIREYACLRMGHTIKDSSKICKYWECKDCTRSKEKCECKGE